MSSKILVLRPEPGASATAAKARALGLEPIVTPLFTIVQRAWDPPNPADFDAVMMTSANAARCGGDALVAYTGLPLYAVGASTAEAARRAGFGEVRGGNGDVAALMTQIAGDGGRRVFHIAGLHHRAASHPALIIIRRIVYASNPIDPPPALNADALILVHSPLAGARLATLVAERDRHGRTILAISARALNATGSGWKARYTATRPDDDALLARATELCKADKT